MTTYHHATFGSHTPKFSLHINDEKINPSQSKEIDSEKITISYQAGFPLGHSSQDSANFTLKPETSKATITFDWNQTPRIILHEE